MKPWLLSLAYVAVLLIILELMLSEGSTKKYIVGLLGIVVIAAFLPVLTNWKTVLTDSTSNPIEETFHRSESYPEQDYSVNTYIAGEIKKTLERRLNAYGGQTCVTVRVNSTSVESISVFVLDVGINNGEENIYTIDLIKKEILAVISMDGDRIYIYGEIE